MSNLTVKGKGRVAGREPQGAGEDSGTGMKKGWKIQPLRALCENITEDIVDGPFGSNMKRKDYICAGIPVLKIQNIKPFKIEPKNMDYLSPAKANELKRHSYRRGDIVMTKLGKPLGISAIVDAVGDGIIVADLVRIRAQRINTKYLCYHLNSPQTNDFINSIQKGTTRPRVRLSAVRELPILVPPEEDQRRIVGILDEAFAGIATAKANAEKNLQNARALFESHLNAIFTKRGEGWVEKTLEEISTTFGRGKSKHRPRNAPHLYGGKYPFIQTGDIRNADHFIREYSQTYSEAGLAQSKLWPKGTICITIAANIAETAILGFDACFPDSVIGVVANQKQANAGFIEYLLQSFKARIQLMGKGSAQANINMGTFEHERFPFPSVTEQERIVAELDCLREEGKCLEFIYRRKIAALEALKKSLLHQAFNGEL